MIREKKTVDPGLGEKHDQSLRDEVRLVRLIRYFET